MKFLPKLSITAKITLSIGIIIVALGAVQLFSYFKSSTIDSNSKILSGDVLHTAEALFDCKNAVLQYQMYQYKHALETSPLKKAEYAKDIETVETTFRKAFRRYKVSHEQTSREMDICRSIDVKWSEFTKINNDILDLSNKGMQEEVMYLLNYETRSNPTSLIDDLSLLTSSNSNNIKQLRDYSNSILNISGDVLLAVFLFVVLFSVFIAIYLSRLIVIPLKRIDGEIKKLSIGEDVGKLKIKNIDEIGNLVNSFNMMSASIRKVKKMNMLSDWFKTGENGLNEQIRGDLEPLELSRRVITFLSKYLNAKVGAIYLWNRRENVLELSGGYSFNARKTTVTTLKLGEGLVGQAALEGEYILLTDVPDDYIFISSSLGYTKPRNLIVMPFMFEETLIGVIELGSLYEFGDNDVDFLKMISENVAISFYSADSSSQIKFLLKESQQKSMELQAQQEELRASNEELESQTQALKLSETKLKEQQEELQTANEELEYKTQSLERQRNEISEKNKDLEIAQKDIEKKAKELEFTSKYKSEFLANMSHELRTPLNSLLILARNLSENKAGNLDADQVESARIIHKSGNDLLRLINEILDLSKIEAGKMTINIERFQVRGLIDSIEATFRHMANEKGLKLDIIVDPDFPQMIQTDFQRLEQVIKNLLSNAIKFTLEGGVALQLSRPTQNTKLRFTKFNLNKAIVISVVDTGIGISNDKQKTIFEAFQQGDGSTARRFGGTGLGLSISREIAKMLGGELQMHSQKDEGSTFSLIIPYTQDHNVEIISLSQPPLIQNNRIENGNIKKELPPRDKKSGTKKISIERSEKTTESNFNQSIAADVAYKNTNVAGDNQAKAQPEAEKPKDDLADRNTILIIEDDISFASILSKQCKERGFEPIVAVSGEEGIVKAQEYVPRAIILDIELPGMTGWRVLDKLKKNPALRHIPIHMMSVDEVERDAMYNGAVGFLTKPVSQEKIEEAFNKLSNIIEKKIKDLLIIQDNTELRKNIFMLIDENNINIHEADNGAKALELIKNNKFDCVILDLGLPDMTGFELLNELNMGGISSIPPIIVYTANDMTQEEELQLKRYTETIIIKGVKSEERLLDETALFLHQMVAKMPEDKKKLIVNMYDQDTVFKNKRILLVDDDMRNVFALSKVLKERSVKVQIAEDGSKAIKILDEDPNFDLILMDIMMPVMDGYEAMKTIRKSPKYSGLPIIALTAKAMKDDREKCIKAGASDYMTKPVNIDLLLSMMRVWLYQ